MGYSLRNAAEYARHGGLRVELINRFRPARPPRLRPRPMPTHTGDSARRINRLLAAFPDRTRYLEIGLYQGETLENVCATYRWGVEPHPKFNATRVPERVSIWICTSDEFFSALDGGVQFDVVFLDGLHRFAQTYRDLVNALRVCRSGFVLIDDVVPSDRASANPDPHQALRERRLDGKSDQWHGDVFKVVVALTRFHSSELTFCTIIDRGNPQTIVWRKSPDEEVLPADSLDLAEVDRLTFDKLLGTGIPDFFFPKEEDTAIAFSLSRGRA